MTDSSGRDGRSHPREAASNGRFWPWFVVALLVATAAGQAIMLYAATSDPTFAVEPDYYRKAVAWDSAMARERASAATGWSATAEFDALPDGRATLRVRLVDSTGSAVPHADVLAIRAILIHNLDGARHTAVALEHDPRAGYTAVIDRARRGLWEIRLDVRGRSGRFTPVLRAEHSP